MLAWWLLGLTAAVLAVGLGAGWALASRILVPRPYGLAPEFRLGDVELMEDGRFAVALPEPRGRPRQHADPHVEGAYALMWEGGYGTLQEPLPEGAPRGNAGRAAIAAGGERNSGSGGGTRYVRRAVALRTGTPPAAGSPARIDNFYYRQDPGSDLGLEYEELRLAGQAGGLRAWYVPAEGSTAVLLLHGRRRGELSETLRFVGALNGLGLPVLALAYRNHDASDPSPDGLYRYGASEWEDAVTGGLELARRGHERAILYGLSMGGAVALQALARWPGGAPEVVGLVLDSPLVNPAAAFRQGALKAGLPAPAALTGLALSVARLRTGVDLGRPSPAAQARDVRVPVLLIAGEADSTVPVATVDEFAAALTSPLNYVRLPGVEHVEAWNHDPVAYAGRLREFALRLPVSARRSG